MEVGHAVITERVAAAFEFLNTAEIDDCRDPVFAYGSNFLRGKVRRGG